MGLLYFKLDKDIPLETEGIKVHLHAANGWVDGPTYYDDIGDYGIFDTEITFSMPEGDVLNLSFHNGKWSWPCKKEKDFAKELRENRAALAAQVGKRLSMLSTSDIDKITDELDGIIPTIKKASPTWREGDEYIPDGCDSRDSE